MDDFIARSSRGRAALLLLLASMLFLVGGAWMAGLLGDPPESDRHSPAMTMVFGWVCMLVSGAAGAMWALRLFDSGEVLRIGRAGIRWTRWSDQVILWQDIAGVTVWSHKRQKMIVLHLRDATRYPGEGLQAQLQAANRLLTGGDIAISLVETDRHHEEAMQAIARFRR